MSRPIARALRVLLAVLLLGALRPALAHEMSMAELDVREAGGGDYAWLWLTASDKRGFRDDDLIVRWPDGCRADAERVHCGEDGLSGRLSVDGVGRTYSAVILRVHWRDGRDSVHTLSSAQPSVQLFGSAEDRRGGWEIARVYGLLGIEHILAGYDHLAFVFGLLFLVGFRRRLLLTITAFTAAHSLTLALSALGWLVLRPPPVEATIALSIMLVASEALRREETAARRWPALVAFLFGLVHGLGFAGALKEIGLPEAHLPIALLGFNGGVEIGQLAVVGGALLLVRLLAVRLPLQRLRVPALYAIGGVAAFWSIGRVAAILLP